MQITSPPNCDRPDHRARCATASASCQLCVIMERVPPQIVTEPVDDPQRARTHAPSDACLLQSPAAEQTPAARRRGAADQDGDRAGLTGASMKVLRGLPAACRDSVGVRDLPGGRCKLTAASAGSPPPTCNRPPDPLAWCCRRWRGSAARCRRSSTRSASRVILQASIQYLRTHACFDMVPEAAPGALPWMSSGIHLLPRSTSVGCPACLTACARSGQYRGGQHDGLHPHQSVDGREARRLLLRQPGQAGGVLDLRDPASLIDEAVPGYYCRSRWRRSSGELPKDRRDYELYRLYRGLGLQRALGEEMVVHADPYDKFGQLTYEMWRAVLGGRHGDASQGLERQRRSIFKANAAN